MPKEAEGTTLPTVHRFDSDTKNKKFSNIRQLGLADFLCEIILRFSAYP